MDDQISRQKLIEDIDNNVVGLTNIQIMQIADIINSQPPASQWIPCSERLPESGQKVLVTLDTPTGKKYIRTDLIEDGEWWQYEDKYVTAWQPLPEPYKGVE